MPRATIQSKYLPRAEYDITRIGFYNDGMAAISITKDGEVWSRPSAYVEGVADLVPEGEPGNWVVIKDYSENEGLANSLHEAGLIELYANISIGFGSGYLCKLGEELRG